MSRAKVISPFVRKLDQAPAPSLQNENSLPRNVGMSVTLRVKKTFYIVTSKVSMENASPERCYSSGALAIAHEVWGAVLLRWIERSGELCYGSWLSDCWLPVSSSACWACVQAVSLVSQRWGTAPQSCPLLSERHTCISVDRYPIDIADTYLSGAVRM